MRDGAPLRAACSVNRPVTSARDAPKPMNSGFTGTDGGAGAPAAESVHGRPPIRFPHGSPQGGSRRRDPPGRGASYGFGPLIDLARTPPELWVIDTWEILLVRLQLISNVAVVAGGSLRDSVPLR
jgi:hypothetical protein